MSLQGYLKENTSHFYYRSGTTLKSIGDNLGQEVADGILAKAKMTKLPLHLLSEVRDARKTYAREESFHCSTRINFNLEEILNLIEKKFKGDGLELIDQGNLYMFFGKGEEVHYEVWLEQLSWEDLKIEVIKTDELVKKELSI